MRRVRRLAFRVLFWGALVVGSLAGLDQWVLHAEPAPAPSDPPFEPAPPRKRAEVPGPFGSPEACAAAWAARSAARVEARKKRGPRVGTWNVRWFPFGSASGKNLAERTNVAWLACAIAQLDVEVLAVQEFLDNVEGRRAAGDLLDQLETLTGDRYRLELDECSGSGRQHVGFLWNEARVQLDELRSIAALNPAGSMCASSLRPGLGARARFADGSDVQLITVHLDSGETARDFDHRARSVEALRELLPPLLARDRDVLVLGDSNAMGCRKCAPSVSAADELARLDATLRTLSLHRLEHGLGNRCSHYYGGHAGLLDLAITSTSLRERVLEVRSDGVCGALGCERFKRSEAPLAIDTLSDHCPVIVQLKAVASRAR